MKIKLAILEKDQSYLNRLVNVFATKYTDKFQIYSFADADVAFSTLETARIEVLIADDIFEIDFKKLPKRCGFAYLVESVGVETLNGRPAICKFQKADLIYKQILSIYSEKAGNVSGLRLSDDSAKIIYFQSQCGAGASSMAAACARRFAKYGKRVLYLNLERFGSADLFFTADGQFNMSDIIFALKSKKTNLALKLESTVRQANNGVFFYAGAKVSLDMMELSTQDIARLISELQLTGGYDYIIADADFSIERERLNLYRDASAIVWVGDGSAVSNDKITRAYEALNILEQSEDVSLVNRVVLVYNKFSNKTSKMLTNIGVRNIGGAPRFEHATSEQVVEQLSLKDMFDVLM